MKIATKDLNLEATKDFLNYFYAALRNNSLGLFDAGGRGHFSDSGYESNLRLGIANPKEKLFIINLKLSFNHEGCLQSIESYADSHEESNQWGTILSNFINEVLLSTISQKKEKFFVRNYFAAISGTNLNGEYWLPGFRFAPLMPEDDSQLIGSERYVVIDQEIDAIDDSHAVLLAEQKASLFTAHLSLLLNIGLYKPSKKYKWYSKHDKNGIKQFRESTLLYDFNHQVKMPKKNTICKLGEFRGSVFQYEFIGNNDFSCPTETRKILKVIKCSDQKIQKAFDRCATLYQIGLNVGQFYNTAMISYFYASIDAITKSLKGEYKGFKDFITKNYKEDVEDIINFIHDDIRSAHFHAGALKLDEENFRVDHLTNIDFHKQNYLVKESIRIIRKSIFNWILESIAKNEKKI
ncbi:hypothetical protein [Leptospira sp. GIMC2001]|uniref:hypothetical protein n=1 Tax=Leptospira sp. GIMC2001 TaxID=1513297 RepID=UPI00234BA3A2|nr:hypothetical protein [Leptospira sp. GIMC2001]WCL50702.1 hypothetical protein O4O04_07800 [Leptospira sp. GIMC2001]